LNVLSGVAPKLEEELKFLEDRIVRGWFKKGVQKVKTDWAATIRQEVYLLSAGCDLQ
jgi:hypothetical protein